MSISDKELAEFRRAMLEGSISTSITPHILTGTTTGIGSVYPATVTAAPMFETKPTTMLYHASIERAENGYILKVQHKQNETAKIYIAATTEELQRVFIAAIVAERVSK